MNTLYDTYISAAAGTFKTTSSCKVHLLLLLLISTIFALIFVILRYSFHLSVRYVKFLSFLLTLYLEVSYIYTYIYSGA